MIRRVHAIVLWCSLWTAPAASAQRIDLDASVGYSSAAWRAAVGSQWRLRVGSRLTLGTGVRLSYYEGESASFRNQGAILPTLPDQLPIDPAVWGLNVMVSAQARVLGPLAVGANIDLVGVAGGAQRPQGTVTLEPARGSLLLYGDRDRGSLNSEFYVAVPVGQGFDDAILRAVGVLIFIDQQVIVPRGLAAADVGKLAEEFFRAKQ